MEDGTVRTCEANGTTISTLYAKQGIVTANPETRILTLDLRDVRGDLRDSKDPTNIQKIKPNTTAARYPIDLDLGRVLRQAEAAKRIPDYDLGELQDEIRSLRGQGLYPAAALMEVHWRVAAAVACVTFTTIGIPLGIKTSRRETSVGIAMSLALAASYFF